MSRSIFSARSSFTSRSAYAEQFTAAFRLSIAHIDHAVLIKIAPRHIRKALRITTPTPAATRSIDFLHNNLATIETTNTGDNFNGALNPEDYAAFQLNLHTSLTSCEEAQLESAFNPDPDADFQTSTGTLDELFPEFDNSDIDRLETFITAAKTQSTAYRYA